MDESQLIEILTDKLIEVAQNPDMRKEFAVKYSVGYAGITHEIILNKNNPPMSDMEQFFLAYHYLMELDTLSEAEDPDEDAVDEITDKAAQWINQVQDQNSFRELLLMYHRCMYDICGKWNDEEGISFHGSEYNKCQESVPKRFCAKKDTFDYWYAKAEKRDWEAMTIVSLCYRDGRLVIANDRLSDCWYKLAKSTYNYYNPNGKPFEEEYIEIESEITTDDSYDNTIK